VFLKEANRVNLGEFLINTDLLPMEDEFNALADRIVYIQNNYCMDVPSVVSSYKFIEELVHFLFPIKDNKKLNQEETRLRMHDLIIQLEALLKPLENHLNEPANLAAHTFFRSVAPVYIDLLEEADCYVKLDPAAWSVEEVILTYPGFFAITVYRLAHILYLMKVPVLPRILTEYAHNHTGIDINPGAQIGKKFYIDHGTGVVIGETARIGSNVKIYQGVTLGALHVEKSLAEVKRHPTIEDNVIIYAGSTILGGNTIVGHDSIIGGNVWLTSSIEPYTVVYREPKMKFRNKKDFTEPLNFVI
jgi:serine O-acetyltransferase